MTQLLRRLGAYSPSSGVNKVHDKEFLSGQISTIVDLLFSWTMSAPAITH